MTDLPTWLQQLIESHTKSQETLIKVLTLKIQQQDDRSAKERPIDKFPAMKDTDNIELFLQSFENEMTQYSCSGLVEALVTIRWTPKMKAYRGEIQQDPMSTYADVKSLSSC